MNLPAKADIGATKTVDFIVLAAAWFFLAIHYETVQSPLVILVVWTFLTTSISLTFLDAVGYFDRDIPKPTWPGLLSLALALPLSALYSKWLLLVITQQGMVRYREIVHISFWVSIIFELSLWIFFELHILLGRRWELIAYVLPKELEVLKAEIATYGAATWISIESALDETGKGRPLEGNEILIISRAGAHHLKNHPDLLAAHLRGQRIVDMNQLLKQFFRRVDLRNSDAWTFLLGSTQQHFLNRLYFAVKTALEPVLAVILLIILSPVLLGLAISLYRTSGRPILYRQQRLGYRGKKFPLLKFRTMPHTAEKAGPQWATVDDPRIPPLGRWLRKTRLDELPQLLNVIKGQLSFVGPRPERPEFYELLGEHIPLFSMRLQVRPGITGWAQVRQGYAASIAESKRKLEYDLYYIQQMSAGFDVEIILDTLLLAIRGDSGR